MTTSVYMFLWLSLWYAYMFLIHCPQYIGAQPDEDLDYYRLKSKEFLFLFLMI